jgi:hypothetical protein
MKNQDQMHYDELDLRVIEGSGRLDANESVFFARQLEYVKGKTYDIKYPAMNALSLFPISTEAGAGAKTITYRQYDSVGMAKVIANYSQDLPRADVTAKEFTSPIRGIGDSYGFDVQEVRYAQMAGVPLETRKAAAARKAHDEKINQLAWFGDADHGLPGFFTNANIPGYTVTADGTGSSKLWSTKTAAQIIRDVNGIINAVRIQSKGVHVANEVWLPIAQYALISSMPRADGTDQTVLKFLQENNPGVTFKSVLELDNALSSGTLDTMVAIEVSADNLTLEIPMPFMQHAPQQEGLAFEIPCESRFAGVLVYYPLAMLLADSI